MERSGRLRRRGGRSEVVGLLALVVVGCGGVQVGGQLPDGRGGDGGRIAPAAATSTRRRPWGERFRRWASTPSRSALRPTHRLGVHPPSDSMTFYRGWAALRGAMDDELRRL